MSRHRAIGITFFLLFILPVSVFAVGIGNMPAQRDYIFLPGMSFEIPVAVVNSDQISTSVTSPVVPHPETLGTPDDDNIIHYVTVDDPAPGTGNREVVIRFALPQQMKPGDYPVDFWAIEGDVRQGTVSAVAATKLRVFIHVLSPEKRLDIVGFHVPPMAEGLRANVTIDVVSRTTQDLESVIADVRVYKDDVLITSASSPSMRLPTRESATLTTYLDTESFRGGEYLVNATVRYDDKSANTGLDVLKIGTLHVGIDGYSPAFTYNVTNRFLFNVSNQWNKELKEVYSEVRIGSQLKKSASQNILPFGKTEYELYFDREELLLPGQINANVTVHFKDFNPGDKQYVEKTESFLLPVAIVLPPVVEKSWWEEEWVGFAVIGTLILLVLIVIILLLVLLLRKSRQQPPIQPTQQQAPSSGSPASSVRVATPVMSQTAPSVQGVTAKPSPVQTATAQQSRPPVPQPTPQKASSSQQQTPRNPPKLS